MRLRTRTLCVLALTGYLYVVTALVIRADVDPNDSPTAVEASRRGQVHAWRRTPDGFVRHLGANERKPRESLADRDASVDTESLAAAAGSRAPTLAPADGFEPERKRFELFVKEERDSSWAGQTEELIRRVLSKHVPPTTAIQSVECRAALCRVATIHSDATAYTNYTLMLKDPAARVWPAGAMTLATAYDHEQVWSITYLARENAAHSLWD